MSPTWEGFKKFSEKEINTRADRERDYHSRVSPGPEYE